MTDTAGQRAPAAGAPRRAAAQLRITLAVAVLAAGAALWAALPAAAGRAGTRPLLAVAVVSAVLTVGQLVSELIAVSTVASPRPGVLVYRAPLSASAQRAATAVLALPWPQLLTVAALALEALHPARPWHTAVLGVVLLALLLTLHLAGTGDGPGVLRPHVPLVAAGLGLAALSAGAAILPAAGPAWLAAVAAIAALLAAGLALPL